MNSYKILKKQIFSNGIYSLVPIRMEDRFDIMQWRNDQIYHLRQNKSLTNEDQNNYFNKIISKLFEQDYPQQILFSYLEGEKCIGYGGLVHINWLDKNAEISFIINTKLEEEGFEKHWGIYLDLLQQIAFQDLKLHKIYTYAFDLRPQLYKVLEVKGFVKEAALKDHCLIDGEFKNVVIHSKIFPNISFRRITFEDKEQIFNWSNDPITRLQSFNNELISFQEHSEWFNMKLSDKNAYYFIGSVNNIDAALIRFDEKDGYAIIGINISPDFRGQKLAHLFLRNGTLLFLKIKNIQIKAYIKKDNIASLKSFEKAGFKLINEITFNNIHSYEYIFEK